MRVIIIGAVIMMAAHDNDFHVFDWKVLRARFELKDSHVGFRSRLFGPLWANENHLLAFTRVESHLSQRKPKKNFGKK